MDIDLQTIATKLFAIGKSLFVIFFGLNTRMQKHKYWFSMALYPTLAAVPFYGFSLDPITQEPDETSLAWFLAVTVWCLCAIAISIRRMHDHNKSAWWVFWYFGAAPAIFFFSRDVLPNYTDWQLISDLLGAVGIGSTFLGAYELFLVDGTKFKNKYGAQTFSFFQLLANEHTNRPG